MGCIILMAVSHKNLDDVAKISAKSLTRQYNRHDYTPKFLNHDGWAEKLENTPAYQAGVVISHYYESNQQSILFVNSDFLLRPHNMTFCKQASSSIEDLIPAINSQAKIKKGNYIKVEDLNRPIKKGDAVSLFALDLDTMERFENNPHAMEDVAQYCRTGHAHIRTFGRGVEILSTIEAGESALVLADRWWFKVAKVPSFEIQFHEDEISLLASLFSRQNSESEEVFQSVFMREFMAGFGYEMQKIVRKPRKKS